MRGRGSKKRWERSDLKTSKERNLLALDQFGRWSRVPPETRENIQLVPELSTSKVCKTGKQTSKPCSQTAEKEPEKLWPHHPRPRQNVIHADMRSMESLYHTPSMCGKTRDGPGEAGHGPRLKSEYGDHCTRPLDQENHVRRFTLILDQVVLRDDQNLLILGQMGLPEQCMRSML
ncbi:hypothetical protein Bca101_071501 [Brassica carinata]